MKNLSNLFVFLSILGVLAGCGFKKEYSDENLIRALKEENISNALCYVNLQLEEFPDDVRARYLRAGVYAEMDSIDMALTDIDTLIEQNEDSDEKVAFYAYTLKTDIFIQVEDYNRALEACCEAEKYAGNVDAGNMCDLLLKKADIYYKLGEYALSNEIYRKILTDYTAPETAMVGLARNMIEQGEYQGAVDILNDCEEYFNNDYDQIYRYRMFAYDGLGDVKRAIDDAFEYYDIGESVDLVAVESILKKDIYYALQKVTERITDDDEDNRLVWTIFKGQIYALGRDYRSAIRLYNRIESQYGENPNTNYYRAQWYAEIGDYDNAIAQMTACVEESGGQHDLGVAYLAEFYRLSGNFEEAIKWFSKLIELVPTDAYGYYKRGWCYELMGDDVGAMRDYNAGVEVDKNYPYLLLMRAEQYLKYGDIKRANADFEEVIKHDTIVEAGSCRMYALHFLGRDAEAIEWMDRLIESDPNDNGFYYDKACLYARMGKLQESVAAFRMSLEKGFRAFAHIEADDDLDPIRELPEFKVLIKKYNPKK